MQDKIPEMNLNVEEKGLKNSSPISAILFLKLAKIEPQTMMFVNPYARKNQTNISILFIYKVYCPNLNLLNILPFVVVVTPSEWQFPPQGL